MPYGQSVRRFATFAIHDRTASAMGRHQDYAKFDSMTNQTELRPDRYNCPELEGAATRPTATRLILAR
jgi:hypothetical protein